MPPVESQNKKKILGLERNTFILGLTSFFNDFSNEMILSAFPAFFTSVLNAGAASLGLVEGLADGASNLLKLYSGALSDRMQKRRVFIFLGYGLSVAMRPFYMFTSSVSAVLGLRVVDRIGKGLRESPRDVIISASSEVKELGRSFGYHKAMDKAGAILGPLAAYLILSNWPERFDLVFLSAFVLGVISVITIIFVKDIVIAKTEDGDRLLSIKSLKGLPLQYIAYLASIFVLSAGSLPIAVLLLTTTSIGLLIASIPLFYMVYSISYSGFSYAAGKLSDKIGTAKVLLAGYSLLILAYFIIGQASTAITLVFGFIVLGMFSASTDATERAYAGRIAPLEKRGTAYGLFNAAVGFGSMVAGIGGGMIWQVYGASAALWSAGFITILGTIILVIAFQMQKSGRNREISK